MKIYRVIFATQTGTAGSPGGRRAVQTDPVPAGSRKTEAVVEAIEQNSRGVTFEEKLGGQKVQTLIPWSNVLAMHSRAE